MKRLGANNRGTSWARALFSLWFPLGLHIHDGLLRAPWLAGGFLAAGGLALLASYRIQEEEIPRIALLSAAFFVASLMHLPLGPASVHLLLTGLVGVVLGRRAPLAILVGVGLQALVGHGGFTTIGVNACVQMLPALLASGLFAVLARLGPVRQRRPGVLWLLGCSIGMTAVLAALLLEAVVLLWGGAEDFRRIVQLVFLAHLPVVVVEGVVLGFTVSFLARVKPEMLGLDCRVGRVFEAHQGGVVGLEDSTHPRTTTTASVSPPAVLLAFFALLMTANGAHAHRLHADYYLLPDRQVRIESYFDDNKPPHGASVEVRRPDGRLLAEGRVDDKGHFVFRFDEAEALEVTINAGVGHQKTIVIPRERLEPTASASQEDATATAIQGPFRGREAHDTLREQIKDALLGISFLLSVAAFLLSCARAAGFSAATANGSCRTAKTVDLSLAIQSNRERPSALACIPRRFL